MDKQLWVLCPICNNKTRTKVREDTELIKFPLFCPKCKTETLINMRRQMADSLEDKPFPALPEDLQCRCWFEFGSAENHLKYRAAVQKAYPHGHYLIFEGCNHMQYQIRDPQGFAAMLTSIIEQNVLPPLPFVKSA